MRRRIGCAVLLISMIGCGQKTLSEKAENDDLLGTDVSELTKHTLSPAIESEHPYKNNVVQKWTVRTPGCATFFRIHFSSIDVEEGYDFVRLVDKDGNKVKAYTGFFSGWSPQLPGTEATVELITDGANTREGFKIDAIEYTADEGEGTWAKTLLKSSEIISTEHPYKDGTTQIWTVKGPPDARAMRLHFRGFETEARYDIVSLFTAEQKQMATYTGKLDDFVSAEVPGNAVVVRLTADPSINGRGFDIIGYEALTPGGPGTCGTPASCLVAAPAKHDFGIVKIGCDATKEIVVTNTCTAPVTVAAPALATGEFSTTFSGAQLAAGASTTLLAKYAPQDLGTDKASLELSAKDASGVETKYTLSLEGAGDKAGVNRDEFVQQAGKADILFVVDDSCSMVEEQTALATNFQSFIKYAKSSGTDLNMAVVTTDMDAAARKGNFVSGTGNPDKVLSSKTTDLEAQFISKVKVGVNGSATEMCFEAAYRALTPPLSTGGNAGFLRSDASLAIVCLTDEPEQSAQAPAFYSGAFLNVKGNQPNMLTFSVIGPKGPSAACLGSSVDPRYESMTKALNGAYADICTPDWSKTLEALGKTTAGFRTQFVLTAKPAMASAFKVFLNGTEVASVDPRGEKVWSVDVATKTLTFTPVYAPEPGSKIAVEYSVACGG